MRHVKTLGLIAGLAACAALGPVQAEQSLSPESREALKAAMLSEAFASAKYKLFAEHARKAGKAELADIMTITANQEYGHFLRWAALYGLVGKDLDNLRQAVQDELKDDVNLYTRLASEADARGDKILAEHFRAIQGQEEKHHGEFEKAVEKAFKPE